jgi:hypothetical protein
MYNNEILQFDFLDFTKFEWVLPTGTRPKFKACLALLLDFGLCT